MALAIVRQRTMTGVGFFLRFAIQSDAEKIQANGQRTLSCVGAELEGVEHGVGFVLFIQDGKLDFLEGFTYEEPWPMQTVLRRWFYLRPVPSRPGALVESPDRDLGYVASQLAG